MVMNEIKYWSGDEFDFASIELIKDADVPDEIYNLLLNDGYVYDSSMYIQIWSEDGHVIRVGDGTRHIFKRPKT
jgi:hypothetical protein